MFDFVWGVMAPMGKLAWGVLAVKIVSKAHEGYALEVTVCYFSEKKRYPEREGSQVVFSLLASKPKTDPRPYRKFGVHCAPCQQNDPNRGGLGVAH